MQTDRPTALPSDAVSIGVLIVTAIAPLTLDEVVRALGHIGAPSWRPLGDVVVGAVQRLRELGLISVKASEGRPGDRLAPSDWGRAVLPDLLYALPLSAASPDPGYKLKVVGLDVLDVTARERQRQALLDHWHGLAMQWQEAEARCPCRQPSVQGWMRHNIDLARSEIEWLSAARR